MLEPAGALGMPGMGAPFIGLGGAVFHVAGLLGTPGADGGIGAIFDDAGIRPRRLASSIGQEFAGAVVRSKPPEEAGKLFAGSCALFIEFGFWGRAPMPAGRIAEAPAYGACG